MRTLRPEVIFASEAEGRDLACESVRGGLAALTAQGIQLLLRMGAVIVLARLLTPNDFGLVAMVAVFVNFVQMFRDSGLSTVTVQREHISPEQVSTLFWLNVLIGVFLSCCVLVSAPLVSRFYGRADLTGMTAAMSVPVMLSGLTIQHQALLRRHLRFGSLACIQITSLAASSAVAIVLACQGWRFWALVAGAIAEAAASVALTFTMCPWLPGRMKRGTGAKESLRFGGYLMGFSFANFFSRNADNLLIGQYLGAEALGLYARAYQIFAMPVSQIRTPIDLVGLPVLSSLCQQPERYLRYYKRLLDAVASMTLPIALYCLLEARFLVEQLLGAKWTAAAPALQILAAAAIIQPLFSTAGLVQLSYGFARRYMLWGIVGAICYVSAFLIGLRFGIQGVALSYVVANYVLFVPTLAYCFRETPVTLALFARSVAIPLGCTVVAVVVGGGAAYLGTQASGHVVFLLSYLGAVLGMMLLRRSVRATLGSIVRGSVSVLSGGRQAARLVQEI